MIDNNSNMLLKVEKYLLAKHINCDKKWLLEKIDLFKTSNKPEEDIYKELLSTDISLTIDKDKVKTFKLNELADPGIIKTKLTRSLFLQINGYSNIDRKSV